MRFVSHALFIAIATILGTTGTYAQDPVPYEGNGLYSANDQKSLGTGIYHQTKKSQITTLIKNTKSTAWAPLNALTTNLLLTQADTTTIITDNVAKNEDDIFTLRLEKLLQWGQHKKAYALYNTLKNSEQSNKTAQNGMITLLLNAERGKACLETKTLYPRFEDTSFWQEMNAYCTVIHSKELSGDAWNILKESKNKVATALLENEDYKIPYNEKTFSEFSLIELALLTAHNAIDISEVNLTTANNISTLHILPVLQTQNLTDEQRIQLYSIAALNGLLDEQDLALFYDKADSNETSPLSQMATISADIKSAVIPATRRKLIEQAFKIANKHGDGILLPLLNDITNIDADDLNLGHVERALRLMLLTETTPPTSWIRDLATIKTDDIEKNKLIKKLVFAINTISKPVDKNEIEASQKIITPYLLSHAFTSGLNIIIENIDSTKNNSDKVFNVYENGFDLAAKKSYTMPPLVIINELERSSKNQHIAKTVLLASVIAANISKNNVHTETLGHITSALKNAGFEPEARKVLAQAILENKH